MRHRRGRNSVRDQQFKAQVALEFAKAQKEAKTKGMSVEKFADKLGVTRQAFYKYRNGMSLPGLEVLRRAQQEFGVDLAYGEMKLDASHFPIGRNQAERARPVQIPLPWAIENVKNDDLEVAVAPSGRKPNAIELVVKIRFKSA